MKGLYVSLTFYRSQVFSNPLREFIFTHITRGDAYDCLVLVFGQSSHHLPLDT